MQELMRIDISADADDVEPLAGFLATTVSCGWEEIDAPNQKQIFRIHTETPLLKEEILTGVAAMFPAAKVEVVKAENKDWGLAWREFFTPVPIKNRFIVVAPWMEEANGAKQGGFTPIIIEPRMAFGTGHHASTFLCLEAISDLAEIGSICPGSRFFDLGTGSGILSIACAKIGLWGIAADTDPLAVENAMHNRTVNKVTSSFDIRMGSLESVEGDTFDLIIANILAEPLKEMAPSIAALMATGASLVLSGILDTQADLVESAYLEAGLPPAKRHHKDEWVALVWE